jgi:hypothetical protein
MDKKKKLKQVQAKETVEGFTFQMDKHARRTLGWLHRYTEEVLGMKFSHSVIVRRAIWMYFLHLMEHVYLAQSKCKNGKQIAEGMMKLHEIERTRLLDAAYGRIQAEEEA